MVISIKMSAAISIDGLFVQRNMARTVWHHAWLPS